MQVNTRVKLTTHQLQEYEDTDDVESTMGASTKAPESPISTNQSDQGHVSDPEQDEGAISSDQDSSDSEVEFENPTGLEALSGGHHQVFSVDVINDTPQSFADIEASPNKQAWLDATQDEYNFKSQQAWLDATPEEYDALVNNGTWVLTELPAGRKALACKWLWRNKFDAVGHFTKYKARLVIKGFMQRCGLDYVEIFAPVLRYKTLRLVLFLVAGKMAGLSDKWMSRPPFSTGTSMKTPKSTWAAPKLCRAGHGTPCLQAPQGHLWTQASPNMLVPHIAFPEYQLRR
ncbi:Aste57867_19144 [Aphanomyces stellatus]|uniref:Aste57867_19144 protein n=1 Tax=Aphanomyces stellatus TaxID=120398 RepID=A0A485LCQ0_9STRA|nr:hypothetical protein As57867_019080 [Aphanomyces stellatus]VFT95866.1 Aste57867_19144 [Aphanomyces stellatus]